MEPRSLVVPYSLLEVASDQSLSREEADKLMVAQGYITKVEGAQVLVGNLPEGRALVAAAPALVGYYTRSDDRLGVMITRADRSVCLVDEVA